MYVLIGTSAGACFKGLLEVSSLEMPDDLAILLKIRIESGITIQIRIRN